MIKAIAVVGPTAVGKTAFSVSLAKKIKAEIISCDSMQVYKHMDIGTAKATVADRGGIPHHMLDILLPSEPYSAADYATDALDCALGITERGNVPIFCGGTGLYLDAVRYGRLDDDGCHDADYTMELLRKAREPGGIDELHDILSELDPQSAQEIHKNNVKRVIRALEIYHSSGVKKSEKDKKSREKSPNIDMLVIGLCASSREVLYDRINSRVDKMIDDGLVEEVRFLYEHGYLNENLTAAQAIGYKEILPYIKGEMTLGECTEKLKTASRRYAKRQLTWFSNRDDDMIWLETDKDGALAPFDVLYDRVKERISDFLG